MLNYTECKEYFKEVQKFAEATGKNGNGLHDLKQNLDYLGTYACHENPDDTECRLFKDFAPYSFYFLMMRKDKKTGEYKLWFNGGLIFHGNHDGGGNGGSPTFSVCLQPTDGWSVHT